MLLNEIKDNQGAHKRSRRLGRGIGSGRGKTCGRGGKGQTARSGVRIKGFEGGQMPLHRRLPKRGFRSVNRLRTIPINLIDIQDAIDKGILNASDKLNMAVLKKAGLIKNTWDGIRLLGVGALKSAITIEVQGASQSAKDAVKKAGGTVTELCEAREEPTNSFSARREKAKETAAKATAARASQKTDADAKAKKGKGAAA
jgi:large subunit ribosomal protein L15